MTNGFEQAVRLKLLPLASMSAFGPKRTPCHGANAQICLGLSVVVNQL